MKLYNWTKFNESTESIESLCARWGIKNWTINKDDLVDVYEHVWFVDKYLYKLPIILDKVNGDFFCYDNNLTSLEGCPKIVLGDFKCEYNNLSNLKFSPLEVGGQFSCYSNDLTTLEGCTKIIKNDFDCSYNNLTSLIGGPKDVWGGYYCHNNYLWDVRGFPELYRGRVEIHENPVFEIIKLFKGVDTDIIIETLNDYNVIRPGKKVNLQLLKYVFDELEIVMPEIEYIKGYEII